MELYAEEIIKNSLRGEVFSANCPSREIMKHITNKWGVLTLVTLIDDTKRYSDLRRKLEGISEKMLAQTLQTLEEDGFVIRKAYPVIPPHVEYSLSPLGQQMALKVKDLVDWIEDNLPAILKSKAENDIK